MYSHRCEECGGYHYENLADEDDTWNDIYEQIAADILSNKDYKINADLQQKTAEKLVSAVNKGFENVGINADRSILAKKLLENVYVFSAAKSATQMKYYRDMMLGEDGAILSKESYIKKIADTGEIFNKTYLSAEYENAYYSTIMADQWNRYADDEILEYSTAGDSHVRASHKLLDKYTAQKSAAFWKTNYPPNGWGCRCTVVPGKIREVSEKQSDRYYAGRSMLREENRDTPFYNNVGISAQIFDEKTHPYFKILNKSELSEIKENINNNNPKFTPKNIDAYEKQAGVTIDKSIFSFLKKETPLVIDYKPKKQYEAYYSPKDNHVFVNNGVRIKDAGSFKNYNEWFKKAVVYHEYGHAIDAQTGMRTSKTITKLMADYRDKYKDDFGKIDDRLKVFQKYAFRNKNYELLEKVIAVRDTVMSLNTRYGMGHTKEYFSNPGKKEAEFIAHSFENKFIGNNVFKKVMPELYNDTIKALDEFLMKE